MGRQVPEGTRSSRTLHRMSGPVRSSRVTWHLHYVSAGHHHSQTLQCAGAGNRQLIAGVQRHALQNSAQSTRINYHTQRIGHDGSTCHLQLHGGGGILAGILQRRNEKTDPLMAFQLLLRLQLLRRLTLVAHAASSLAHSFSRPVTCG